MNRKRLKAKSLIGRQVYFRMNKKVLATTTIMDLTPNKLYTIVAIQPHNGLARIVNDNGRNHNIARAIDYNEFCSFLCLEAKWSLKREPKNNG